ncbi:thiamine kinase-like enzyme [Tamaricihabitans halophyticus]|uniref:Thiamine kinase-like enzyme n=1 Tax=Tamaricihabitans halophyticus TaxID=1262583 RepID=A0A4R2R535_9PSEU|nr:choline kinase family protein [Tamaricihabitans halophyticus]TCP56838.1 thiamine kinase-like enzyme [Tamaricihabitans halophyticus]
MGIAEAEQVRDAAILGLLDRSAVLAAHPRSVEELVGGLTNRNFKVTNPNGCYVARVSSTQGDLLAINREHEHRNSIAAAEAGVGAPVVDYLPGEGLLVVGFLDGRTYHDADLSNLDNLRRVAESCRELHAGPRFNNGFSMFDVQPRYLNIVRSHNLRLPDRYLDFLPQVERIQQALAVRDEGTVPCNNDLLAENFIDDGAKIWIIDYEYSGNNDPCFELGNIWSEASLPIEHLGELVTAYYGRPLRNKFARARLLGLMSKYGWMLWASIQAGTSEIDFDFWSWGMEKYERAVAEFDGPEFETLLADAQQTD